MFIIFFLFWFPLFIFIFLFFTAWPTTRRHPRKSPAVKFSLFDPCMLLWFRRPFFKAPFIIDLNAFFCRQILVMISITYNGNKISSGDGGSKIPDTFHRQSTGDHAADK